MFGDDKNLEQDLMVQIRTALLDALEALSEQRDAVIVIGAQAVYLRTKAAHIALAESTKDSDLALDPRVLSADPRIDQALHEAHFRLDPEKKQPGAWLSARGYPVDLMVPAALSGRSGKSARSVRLPPHDDQSARRARGLEAAVVDNTMMLVVALDPADGREILAKVAGPSALIIAKLHKISERLAHPQRLMDKDAHDLYRILLSYSAEELAASWMKLLEDPVSAEVAQEAQDLLNELFAAGPYAQGSAMAGRAEFGIGEPETVSLATSYLAHDLVERIEMLSAGA